jgi:sugar/nucleoside kinase (ribokinase family)
MKYIDVIGQMCIDVIMHYPKSVEVNGEKLWAEDVVITAGGSGVYFSMAMAHLNERVRMYGPLGDDEESEKILRDLQKINVDCSNITILKDTSTNICMLVCDGPKGNYLGGPGLLPLTMPSIESLRDTKLIYVAGYMLYKEFWTDESFEYFKRAHELGIPIVIDGQWTLSESFNSNPDNFAPLVKTLPFCSVYLAATKELCYLKNRSEDGSLEAAELLETGLRTAVVKLGSKGAVAYEKGGAYRTEGYQVEDVYDNIGSGDIFGAAYTHGFLCGWPTRQCLEFANVFAALSILRYKKRKQFPLKETVLNIVKERGVHLA